MGRIDDVLEGLRRELGDEPEVADVPAAVDAMARAFRHARTGDISLSGSEVARMLGVSRQAVNQRAGRGSLLAIADGQGVRYPGWQFRDGSPVRGLRDLVRSARDAGVDDAALATWIEADQDRVAAVTADRADSLIARVGDARRVRTPVTRRRAPGRAPKLTDSSVA
jgi:hypothetical protein